MLLLNSNTSHSPLSNISIWISTICLITLIGCRSAEVDSMSASTEPLNILWLVTEDMGPYIPPFGDSTTVTPHLSRLAAEGVVYPHFYSTSGVCAPSRAAIATGMYPSGIGANHMRTNSYTEVTGLPAYEAVPAPEVQMVSEQLRAAGYYCTNNYKEDYQFKAPMTAWDESGPYAHWRDRAEGQPFYAVFNFTDTHESGLFEPYGHRHIETRHHHAGDRTYTWGRDRMTEEQTPHHIDRDTDFPIPPYLPDTEIVHRDMWKMYNNISEMDRQVGSVLRQLEEDGLLDNTIIFFYGDHGGPLPRQKRLIYDSGLNTPLIIRHPDQEDAGTTDEQMLSFIDLAPTLLSLVGIEPPAYMDGRAFLGAYEASGEREYIHAAADRFDAITDAIRAVRNKRYKYIKNYRPDQPYYLPIEYRERIPTMVELIRLHEAGQLDSVQEQWFRETKPEEELFDCETDPHELHNLAEDPAYADLLSEMRVEMKRWLDEIGDQPNMPERELIDRLWEGSDIQPLTAAPTISVENDKVSISSTTAGASVGYQIIPAQKTPKPRSWQIYSEPFSLEESDTLLVRSHRIGYRASIAQKVTLADLR